MNDVICCNCGTPGKIEYHIWESPCGGFEDYNYRCNHGGLKVLMHNV
jgi:hypothetical protein